MQRNNIFLGGNASCLLKYSNTLFCEAWLSDIQLPLDFIFFPTRHLYTRSIREDDELVVVTDPYNMVEIDQVGFVCSNKAELIQHVLEMFQCLARDKRSFVDQVDDRVVAVCFEAEDFVYHKKENPLTRRHRQAEIFNVSFVDVHGEIVKEHFALLETLAFREMPFHRVAEFIRINGFQQVVQRTEPYRLDGVLVMGRGENDIEIGIVGEQQEVESVLMGHFHVEENKVWLKEFQHFFGFFYRCGSSYLRDFGRETDDKLVQNITGSWLVVDDQRFYHSGYSVKIPCEWQLTRLRFFHKV